VCERFNAAPYYHLLGLSAQSDQPGMSRVTLSFKPELQQLYGGIHGGALLSLADSAIAIAVATTFEDDESTATVDLSMHFIRPAGQSDLVAIGSLVKPDGRLRFGECVIRAGDREIGRAHGICYVAKRKSP
jgi:uncharacterized protein (TIGR00369 family)